MNETKEINYLMKNCFLEIEKQNENNHNFNEFRGESYENSGKIMVCGIHFDENDLLSSKKLEIGQNISYWISQFCLKEFDFKNNELNWKSAETIGLLFGLCPFIERVILSYNDKMGIGFSKICKGLLTLFL